MHDSQLRGTTLCFERIIYLNYDYDRTRYFQHNTSPARRHQRGLFLDVLTTPSWAVEMVLTALASQLRRVVLSKTTIQGAYIRQYASQGASSPGDLPLIQVASSATRQLKWAEYLDICVLVRLFFHAVYVVFGAAGAVGSDLVSRLAQQQGAAIVASDRDHGDLDQVKSATEMHPADVQDEAAVSSPHVTSSAHLMALRSFCAEQPITAVVCCRCSQCWRRL